jgi:ABC-2 type transport system ATP-binding protein
VIRDGTIIADLPTAELMARFAEDRFEVRVAGLPDSFTGKLPAGARVEAGADATRVVLRDANQGRLHNFLADLRAPGIPLLSVTQAQPDLEEIFLRLIGSGAKASGASRRAADETERTGVTP